MKTKAFTLIELLIVVMIIAILAAIALPNFLEFQTRAKVSRAAADMRSIAVGLEAYAVENGVYPNLNIIYGATHPNGKLIHRLKPVTTPIAYMTTLPNDLFNPGIDDMSRDGHDIYTYAESVSGGPAFVTDYASLSPNPQGIKWMLLSYGPIQDASDFPDYNPAIMYWETPYDPTNGTVSIGCIQRFGP